MILSILLLLLEVVLAVYRIKTHSMQQRLTAVLRTASLLILTTFCALSVLTWGFRYYVLATVLVISAVMSAARFLNKRVTATKLQPTRIILKTVGMSALLIISMIPAIIFPEYRPLPTTGEYQVVTATRYLCDESRIETYTKHGGARTLATEFWYPGDTEGNFPLVVFRTVHLEHVPATKRFTANWRATAMWSAPLIIPINVFTPLINPEMFC